MRLGILADIHEHVEQLQACLELLQREGVDRLILLGDVAETGSRLPETVAVLRQVDVAGVFGNHDLGLCDQPDAEIRARYPESVLSFFEALEPRLAVGDCLFTHGAPWWDATDPAEYYLGEDPYAVPAPDQGFDEYRVLFMGHFHRWKVAVDGRLNQWDGQGPIELRSPNRYLVTIHAVMNGWCSIYDQESCVLHPYRIGP